MSVDVDSLPVFRFFLPCSRLHAAFCLAHEIFYASFLFVSVSVVVIVALVTPIHDFVTFRTWILRAFWHEYGGHENVFYDFSYPRRRIVLFQFLGLFLQVHVTWQSLARYDNEYNTRERFHFVYCQQPCLEGEVSLFLNQWRNINNLPGDLKQYSRSLLLRLTDRGTRGWICNRKIYGCKYKCKGRYSV